MKKTRSVQYLFIYLFVHENNNILKESTETYSFELTPYKGLCVVVCLST